MTKDVKIPENHQRVMLYLVVKDALKFIDFTRNVFGAKETVKVMKDENTIMHAEVMIGECTICFADCTDTWEPQPANIFIYAGNADETYIKAIEAGATVITELADQIYGRSGGVKDPFGNTWWITSVI
jgi:PhnB protein